ncbi:MAG TPA: hypothetical protein VK897_13800 [Anaerolineales bacterium]|nr:hypothetical protein [Anaerolineales bacterium]
MPISSELRKEYCEKRKEALAKQYCYGDRLKRITRRNRWLEAGLAVFTGGTFLSFLADLAVPASFLIVLTGIFGMVAFILSMIKSIWSVNEELQSYSELYTTYSLISIEFEELADLVRTDENLEERVFGEKFAEAIRLRKRIIDKEDTDIDTRINQVEIMNRVNQSLPAEKCAPQYISTKRRVSQTKFEVLKT